MQYSFSPPCCAVTSALFRVQPDYPGSHGVAGDEPARAVVRFHNPRRLRSCQHARMAAAAGVRVQQRQHEPLPAHFAMRCRPAHGARSDQHLILCLFRSPGSELPGMAVQRTKSVLQQLQALRAQLQVLLSRLTKSSVGAETFAFAEGTTCTPASNPAISEDEALARKLVEVADIVEGICSVRNGCAFRLLLPPPRRARVTPHSAPVRHSGTSGGGFPGQRWCYDFRPGDFQCRPQ